MRQIHFQTISNSFLCLAFTRKDPGQFDVQFASDQENYPFTVIELSDRASFIKNRTRYKDYRCAKKKNPIRPFEHPLTHLIKNAVNPNISQCLDRLSKWLKLSGAHQIYSLMGFVKNNSDPVIPSFWNINPISAPIRYSSLRRNT